MTIALLRDLCLCLQCFLNHFLRREESRQLELSEADPSSDCSVTVITSATRTTRQQREEEEEEQEQQRGSNSTSLAGRLSVASAVDSSNNGSSSTTSSSSRGQLRETNETAAPSIATGRCVYFSR